MATTAQILANRENARHSTGPQTQSGKNASSRNATRHGLTGTQIVMPGEDASAYEELRQGLHASYKPGSEVELILVDQVAANAWRLMRAQRVETAVLAKLVEGAADPDAALAAAFLEQPADLARIQRYVNAANSAYYKAMRELEKLQAARAEAEHEQSMELAMIRAMTAAPAATIVSASSAPAIGFVSHASATPRLPQAA